ncbi:MAG: enhanced serine sensitivity protein SseB C-terminal domain-containing protein [Alphaproteobacteria bacterium]|nr:enhanced serine sensitivity protein SseB C-terminal domain-containing protein [Alphaproteobacteria bacterium]
MISENELERALIEAAKNPAAAPDFYRLLLESDLLVIGTAEGLENASEEFALSAGGKLNLVTGVKEGAQYLPVFSSMARMQEFVNQESKYLSIRGRDLLDITRGAPVILNPASEFGKELSAREILRLLDGLGAGIPHYNLEDEVPEALIETLSSVFSKRADVIAAWMIKVGFSEDVSQRHPLVGIELDAATGGDWPSLMKAIEDAAQAGVPGMVFDLHRVDRANPIALTQVLVNASPFFVRAPAASSLN